MRQITAETIERIAKVGYFNDFAMTNVKSMLTVCDTIIESFPNRSYETLEDFYERLCSFATGYLCAIEPNYDVPQFIEILDMRTDVWEILRVWRWG